ncbi:MAG TPA: response regulator [Blastocatellia bacterium]|nr:response regulator [Blastocatellia bacterium]
MEITSGAKAEGMDYKTLLIVDDDEEWTELLRSYFHDRYEVRIANFAGDAIEIARNERPSVIILDLVMPSMDGFGMLHRLNDSTERRIPTILLTGWNTPEVEECAAAAGCVAVLGKPVSLETLDEVISSIVCEATARLTAAVTIH